MNSGGVTNSLLHTSLLSSMQYVVRECPLLSESIIYFYPSIDPGPNSKFILVYACMNACMYVCTSTSYRNNTKER